MTIESERIIKQTKLWVEQLVVAHNICPFARKEVKAKSIRYQVVDAQDVSDAVVALLDECRLLDEKDDIETTLLILPTRFEGFYDYLDLV
ncbi:MAG: DUF1415 family protein, partial [Cellvibrionales bacterium]|nr:DUF1415 family protein [Cellvibrionales bacterium]